MKVGIGEHGMNKPKGLCFCSAIRKKKIKLGFHSREKWQEKNKMFLLFLLWRLLFNCASVSCLELYRWAVVSWKTVWQHNGVNENMWCLVVGVCSQGGNYKWKFMMITARIPCCWYCSSRLSAVIYNAFCTVLNGLKSYASLIHPSLRTGTTGLMVSGESKWIYKTKMFVCVCGAVDMHARFLLQCLYHSGQYSIKLSILCAFYTSPW